ncbi:hypothetical protein PPERSA_05097 [Pseudocohnilembus persalinus]|uniref:Uncharacterized protein n=1 Tax=Pseudocohnilembus persalinus TaxID=266149 RepID=A0A0V0QWB7_PSEPJ|nr:hypothetical protein PPERSA_05097 [Pseudocohnilembus persalinus]|eukprot:KRX06484.1 hypothetical protein PPERSA_05097 [Pseudocohnilembus persalinus]
MEQSPKKQQIQQTLQTFLSPILSEESPQPKNVKLSPLKTQNFEDFQNCILQQQQISQQNNKPIPQNYQEMSTIKKPQTKNKFNVITQENQQNKQQGELKNPSLFLVLTQAYNIANQKLKNQQKNNQITSPYDLYIAFTHLLKTNVIVYYNEKKVNYFFNENSSFEFHISMQEDPFNQENLIFQCLDTSFYEQQMNNSCKMAKSDGKNLKNYEMDMETEELHTQEQLQNSQQQTQKIQDSLAKEDVNGLHQEKQQNYQKIQIHLQNYNFNLYYELKNKDFKIDVPQFNQLLQFCLNSVNNYAKNSLNIHNYQIDNPQIYIFNLSNEKILLNSSNFSDYFNLLIQHNKPFNFFMEFSIKLNQEQIKQQQPQQLKEFENDIYDQENSLQNKRKQDLYDNQTVSSQELIQLCEDKENHQVDLIQVWDNYSSSGKAKKKNKLKRKSTAKQIYHEFENQQLQTQFTQQSQNCDIMDRYAFKGKKNCW